MRTTGNWAHTCVPWSGMMVKRTMPSSRRIQQTFPSDEREAVNSVGGWLAGVLMIGDGETYW